MSTELVQVEIAHPTLIKPIIKAAEMIAWHKEVSELIREAFEKGRDYGNIPGTKGNTLFKPGAERLIKIFGCTSKFTLIEKEINQTFEYEYQNKYDKVPKKLKGFYRYVYKCEIVAGDGRIIGECDGSCSTMESKYASRPHESENTVIKMAQKRAMVGAALNAFGLSDRFTQDLEDLKEDEKKISESQPQVDPGEQIYTGSEDEEKELFDWLKERKVPEERWREVSIKLSGKPKKYSGKVLKELTQ